MTSAPTCAATVVCAMVCRTLRRLTPRSPLLAHVFHQTPSLGPARVIPTWKRRFFCLRDGALLYFTDESAGDSSLRGAVPLNGGSLLVDDEEPMALKLRKPLDPNARRDTPQVLSLRAPSYEDAERWAWALYQCAQQATESGATMELPRRQRGSLLGKIAGLKPAPPRAVTAGDANAGSMMSVSVKNTSSADSDGEVGREN